MLRSFTRLTWRLKIPNSSVHAAANELRDKAPLPMNSMLQKEDRKVAVEGRQARQKMEVVNVPPTTPCKLYLLSMYQ